MKKKTPEKRRPCANCGDLTSFANATGDREKLGFCGPCFKQREKNRVVRNDGTEAWLEPRRMYDSGRLGGTREQETP